MHRFQANINDQKLLPPGTIFELTIHQNADHTALPRLPSWFSGGREGRGERGEDGRGGERFPTFYILTTGYKEYVAGEG